LFVGVDIAPASATVAWTAPTPTQLTIPQTPAGYQTLITRLAATGVPPAATLVALEATSTYWLPLACALTDAGLVVSVINPAQAHHFAQALLRRAKTDQLDAQLLAAFAAQVQPPPWTPPRPSIMNASSAWPSAPPCSSNASRWSIGWARCTRAGTLSPPW
jgi:transposase